MVDLHGAFPGTMDARGALCRTPLSCISRPSPHSRIRCLSKKFNARRGGDIADLQPAPSPCVQWLAIAKRTSLSVSPASLAVSVTRVSSCSTLAFLSTRQNDVANRPPPCFIAALISTFMTL